MWKKIIPPIVVALAEWALKKLKAWLKERSRQERIRRGAKKKIEEAKNIRDRKERAKRINDIINN